MRFSHFVFPRYLNGPLPYAQSYKHKKNVLSVSLIKHFLPYQLKRMMYLMMQSHFLSVVVLTLEIYG